MIYETSRKHIDHYGSTRSIFHMNGGTLMKQLHHHLVIRSFMTHHASQGWYDSLLYLFQDLHLLRIEDAILQRRRG